MKLGSGPIRRGQSLVEFAVVSLVLYLLLAAILTFGQTLYVAQGLQSAADLAAREISRTPLGVDVESLDRDDGSVQYALSSGHIRTRIYDDAYLVLDLDVFYDQNPNGNVFTDIVPNLPLLNQQLVTMMIVDRPVIGDGPRRHLLRYPGAILERDDLSPPAGVTYDSWVATDLTVGIPVVNPDDSLQWVGVVEEIENGNDNPFNLFNANTNGIVALRINYPFQSASMSGFRPRPPLGEPGDTDMGSPILASAEDENAIGTYAGADGLGVQQAFGQNVRPFRRVISAQAIYRREIFE